MLPDPGRGEQDALGLLLGPGGGGGGPGDLVLEGVLQGRRAELVLAEEVELAALLEVEEVGQTVLVYAFIPCCGQEGAVDVGEVRGFVAEDGSGQDVVLAAVRAGAVEVGHLGEDAGGRAGEEAGQGGDRLGSLVGGGSTKTSSVSTGRNTTCLPQGGQHL
jgi:hypothetical protein